MSELRRCSNCGNVQTTGDFCSECGERIKTKRRPRAVEQTFMSSTILTFIGWAVILAGLFGSYETYINVRTWGGSLESGAPSSMAVVGNVGYTAESSQFAGWIAFSILLVTVSLGSILIGIGKLITLIAQTQDAITIQK